MTLLTSSHTLQAYYLAMFGRAADPDGLAYWQDRLDRDELELDQVLEAFSFSDEFNARLDDASFETDAWVNELYFDLFGREADGEGSAYWSGRLENTTAPASEIQALLGATSPIDAEALMASTAIADFYSRQVDTERYDPEQPLLQRGFRSNEQLYEELTELDARYDTLQVEQVGASLEGRPIFRADVGEGPRKLMIVTQQHGDEPTGTESAMYLLEWLSGDSEAAQALRQEVSVTVMPRVNPDGFERWEQLVAGELDPEDTVAPRRNSADVDLNRTWAPGDDEHDPADIPESLAVRSVLDALQPDLVLDYHNQNNYTNELGMLETMSTLWATNDEVDSELTAVAQQAAVAIAQGSTDYDFGTLSLYPGGETPQIARNGLGLEGYPALLIEQRGLEEMQLAANEGLDVDYTALFSALTLEGMLSMLSIIQAMAEDGFESIDPELALLIPERGERTPYEDIYAEELVLAADISLPWDEEIAMADDDATATAGEVDHLPGEIDIATAVGIQELAWQDVAA